jgi:hypothetical protein
MNYYEIVELDAIEKIYTDICNDFVNKYGKNGNYGRVELIIHKNIFDSFSSEQQEKLKGTFALITDRKTGTYIYHD